jgi:hypothetical protein
MNSLSVKLGVIFVVIIIFSPYNLLAEQDSIWFSGMEVKIGMARDTVLSQIGKNYKITKLEGIEDMWNVLPKDGGDMVGNIHFGRDGKVLRVTKFWGSFGNHQGYEFAINFFNLLSNLQAEGKKVAYFNTLSVKEPKTSIQSITFFLDVKQVDVFIGEDEKYGRHMSINETLGK